MLAISCSPSPDQWPGFSLSRWRADVHTQWHYLKITERKPGCLATSSRHSIGMDAFQQRGGSGPHTILEPKRPGNPSSCPVVSLVTSVCFPRWRRLRDGGAGLLHHALHRDAGHPLQLRAPASPGQWHYTSQNALPPWWPHSLGAVIPKQKKD